MSDSDDLCASRYELPLFVNLQLCTWDVLVTLPRNTSVAGPSRTADNIQKGAHAPVSIYADDDEVRKQERKQQTH